MKRMERIERAWVLFEELDEAAFNEWLAKQPDADAIAREIGGVYMGRRKTGHEAGHRRVIASLKNGRVVFREAL